MACSRRKGADKIDDPKKCDVTFAKRSHGLLKKASALSSLTGARVALIVFSPKDKLCYFGEPSVEEVFFEYLRRKGDVSLPMSPKEGVDWAERERDSCTTKEDSASWTMKSQALLYCPRKEFKDCENNPSVNAGTGDNSVVRVGAGNDFKILNGDEINSLGRNDAICNNFLTLPIELAAGSESLGMDFNLMCSDL